MIKLQYNNTISSKLTGLAFDHQLMARGFEQVNMRQYAVIDTSGSRT
jgi:hypothetical protein